MDVGNDRLPAPGSAEEVGAGTPKDVRRVMMRERRAAAWKHLNVMERDVVMVMSALCKVSSSCTCEDCTIFGTVASKAVLSYHRELQLKG